MKNVNKHREIANVNQLFNGRYKMKNFNFSNWFCYADFMCIVQHNTIRDFYTSVSIEMKICI